jgi:HEAT repeat protein
MDADWTMLVQHLSRQLQLNRPVQLRQSKWATMPMTWGLVYPTILLPVDADDWDAERRAIVLIHELAHIKRWDHLTQFITQLVCALHWFNPLIWYATREMNKERERACDDFVLAAGTQPTEYAGHILDIARTFHAGRLTALATVSMARRSQLEGRLMAILDPHLSRRTMSRLATAACWLAGLLLVFPLAAMRPWADPNVESVAVATESGTVEVAASRPDTVIRHPQPTDALNTRWTWAQDQTRTYGHERGTWVGYSIHRLMRENEFIQRNGHLSFSGHFNTDLPIREILTGLEQPHSFRVSRETANLVSKEVAVLFRLTPEGQITEEVALNDLSLGMDFGNRPLIWLGDADNRQSIELLKTMYKDAENARLKERVISALGVHQEPDLVAPFLIQTIRSNEQNGVRENAAFWLGQQDTPEALDVLTQTVRSDPSMDVREKAVSSIAMMAAEASTDALIDIAQTDNNAEVQKQATFWLGQKAPEKTKSVLEDIAYARMSAATDTSKKDLELMRQAIHALAELDNGAGIPQLIKIARTHSIPEIRAEAVYWLGDSDAEAVLPVLEEFLFQSEDEMLQNKALHALSELDNDQGIPTLIRAARTHSNDEVRAQAVYWLGDSDAGEVVPLLEEIATTDANPEVQNKAVYALSELDDDAGIPTLIKIARSHPNREIRSQAVYWLGDSESAEAATVLEDLALNDPDQEVQKQALYALAELDGDAGMPVLVKLARSHPNRDTRAQAVHWLGESDAAEAVTVLEGFALNDPDQEVQEQAVYALAELDGERGVPSLVKIAQTHPSKDTRKQAVYWLGDSDAESALTLLEQLAFEDEDSDVRDQAVYALSELDDARGLQALIKIARTHPDRETRRQAIHWLGESGDERALNALIEIIESNEE